jgi:hypothetical protein
MAGPRIQVLMRLFHFFSVSDCILPFWKDEARRSKKIGPSKTTRTQTSTRQTLTSTNST